MNANQFDLGETSATFFVNGSEVNWNVAPNPFSSYTTLTVDLPQSGDVNITMIDMLGRTVWSRNYADQYGVNNYTIVRNDIAAGVYNVILTYGGQTAVQKVVVD